MLHGCRVPAHKEVFFSHFPGVLNNVNLQPNELKFEELSGGSLHKLVDYSYEGTCGPFTDEVELFEIHSFAKMYGVDDLEDFCTDHISRFFTPENCIGYYLKYREDFAHVIRTACLDFIINNFTIVSRQPEFIQINFIEFEKMLKSEKLIAPENDIFLAYLKWFYMDPNFTFASNVKMPLQKKHNADILLEHIRFPFIPVDVSNFFLTVNFCFAHIHFFSF